VLGEGRGRRSPARLPPAPRRSPAPRPPPPPAGACRGLRDLTIAQAGTLTDANLLALRSLGELTRLTLSAPCVAGPAQALMPLASPEESHPHFHRHFLPGVTPLGLAFVSSAPALSELAVRNPAAAFWSLSFPPHSGLARLALDGCQLRDGCRLAALQVRPRPAPPLRASPCAPTPVTPSPPPLRLGRRSPSRPSGPSPSAAWPSATAS